MGSSIAQFPTSAARDGPLVTCQDPPSPAACRRRTLRSTSAESASRGNARLHSSRCVQAPCRRQARPFGPRPATRDRFLHRANRHEAEKSFALQLRQNSFPWQTLRKPEGGRKPIVHGPTQRVVCSAQYKSHLARVYDADFTSAKSRDQGSGAQCTIRRPPRVRPGRPDLLSAYEHPMLLPQLWQR